jgi:carbon monoxide dehydrogenase subunit G
MNREPIPEDGYGPGYVQYAIRQDYRDLCAMIGPRQAEEAVRKMLEEEPRYEQRKY